MTKRRITISLDEDIYRTINRVRGHIMVKQGVDLAFSKFVNWLLEYALKSNGILKEIEGLLKKIGKEGSK